MREALVIGFGSIGQRHASVLAKLGLRVTVVSRRDGVSHPFAGFKSLDEAFRRGSYDYVVLTTETSHHLPTLEKLASLGYRGRLLVEKPLFNEPAPLPAHAMSIFVGYQLRFHPIVRAARDMIAGEDCISADFYVGQHLDSWRPDRDSRETYSSKAALGGGVLRDLSHELDLAAWLLGSCQKITAFGGRMTELTVDSDDAWGILGQFSRCPVVSLQLNYLDRIGQRTMTLVTPNRTIRADLVAGTIVCNGAAKEFKADRDGPIEAMHQAVIDNGGKDVCSEEAGLDVVNMIAAIERAAQSRAWVVP